MQLGAVDRRQGHWEESLRNFDRAAELDPRNFVNAAEAAFTRLALRHFGEGKTWLERALAISPKDYVLRMEFARLSFYEHGDTGPWLAELDAISQEGRDAETHVAPYFVWYALAQGDPAAAARALAVTPVEGAVDLSNNFLYPREWFVGLLAHSFGDTATAQQAFGAARKIAEKLTEEQPEYAQAWNFLGLVDAGLGRKEEAIAEGRHACALLPISRDTWEGPYYVLNLAMIYAWLGEKDLAFEQLAISAQSPGGVTYGELKRSLVWKSLRDDPRFDALLQQLLEANP